MEDIFNVILLIFFLILEIKFLKLFGYLVKILLIFLDMWDYVYFVGLKRLKLGCLDKVGFI